MTANTFTNSSLATARSCLTKYDLRYNLQLELDVGQSPEALQVGTCWHRAHDAQAKGLDPFAIIRKHAPDIMWAEKLSRLFAAYAWRWNAAEFEIEQAEQTFKIDVGPYIFEGQIDGIIRIPDGRRGVLERKTTGDPIEGSASYWDRLRLDVQVGLYSVAVSHLIGETPAFILYDVVRKPSISPKAIVKADGARMDKELAKTGVCTYFGQTFAEHEARPALDGMHESTALYGARLTADIGDRPGFYFGRREVPRTSDDYAELLRNLVQQVRVLEHAQAAGLMHRNPDACDAFGTCEFFGLCSNGVRPTALTGIPDRYRKRAHVHPELARDPSSDT